MQEKELGWYRVAGSGDEIALGENGIGTIELAGKTICLARHAGRWYAFAHKCPHAGGLFSAGHIDPSGNIVCPVHRYRYNMKNGWNASGEGFYLKTYPVESRSDGLYIGIEKNPLLGLI